MVKATMRMELVLFGIGELAQREVAILERDLLLANGDFRTVGFHRRFFTKEKMSTR